MPYIDAIVPGRANSILANTTYALPVGSYRFQTNGIITFSSTVDGSFTTLTGANGAPGVLTTGGFVRASADRIVVAKKVTQLVKSYANLVGRSNPLSYWRLGESLGNTCYDYIGQNHLAKGSGVTLAQAGPLGDGNYAALFDGTSNAELTTSSGVNPWSGASSISFEAWVYNASWQAATHEMIISLGAQGIYMSVSSTKLIMSIHLGSQFTNTALVALATNTWIHIACTWTSGDYLRLYVNGVEVAGDNPTVRTGTISSSANIFVGAFGGTALFYSGVLDEVALYLRKLTATEINNHYAARLVS